MQTIRHRDDRSPLILEGLERVSVDFESASKWSFVGAVLKVAEFNMSVDYSNTSVGFTGTDGLVLGGEVGPLVEVVGGELGPLWRLAVGKDTSVVGFWGITESNETTSVGTAGTIDEPLDGCGPLLESCGELAEPFSVSKET